MRNSNTSRRKILKLLALTTVGGAGVGAATGTVGANPGTEPDADGYEDLVANNPYFAFVGPLDSEDWYFDLNSDGAETLPTGIYDLSAPESESGVPNTLIDTLSNEFYGFRIESSLLTTTLNSEEHGILPANNIGESGDGNSYEFPNLVFRLVPFNDGGISALGVDYTPEDCDDDGLYEDVNGDGTVDARDQRALQTILSSHTRAKRLGLDPGESNGRVQRLTGEQKLAFDFNNDGKFDRRDVAELGRQISRGTACDGGDRRIELTVDRRLSIGASDGVGIFGAEEYGGTPHRFDGLFSITYEIENTGTQDLDNVELLQYCDYDIVNEGDDSGGYVGNYTGFGVTSDYVYTNDTVTDQYSNGWYDSDWEYRKKITIDSAEVAADLTDFPVYIHLEDQELAYHAQSDADDIVFTAGDGTTKLDHELDYVGINVGGGSGLGLTVDAHVKVPSLSSTGDTTLYMYYGNDSASNQENVAGVWSNGYEHVYHLTDPGDGVAEDSAGTNDGTVNGPTEAAGQIYDGYEFDGTDDRVDLSSISDTNDYAVTAWANHDSPSDGDFDHVFARKWNAGIILRDEGDGQFYTYHHESSGWQPLSTSVSANTWTYWGAVYDGTTQYLYKNGAQAASQAVGAPASRSEQQNTIGAEGTGSGYRDFFDGTIDELRFSNTSRSTDWLSTTYNNQNSPSTFHTVSGEQVYEVNTGFMGQESSDSQEVGTYNNVESQVKSGSLDGDTTTIPDADVAVALGWELGQSDSDDINSFTVGFGIAGDRTTLEERLATALSGGGLVVPE